MRFAAAVQQVEIVRDGGWWQQNGGSVAIAVAAVIAAGLAAYVAIRNTRQQLDHDRELRNREHIRDTIDEAASKASDLRTSIDKLVATVQALEKLRNAEEEAGQVDPERESNRKKLIGEREDEALSCLFPSREVAARLELRLDGQHSIVTSYRALHGALYTALVSSSLEPGEWRSQEIRDGDQLRGDEVKKAYDAFRQSCRSWSNE